MNCGHLSSSLDDLAILIHGLSVITGLGKSGLLPGGTIGGVIDGTDKRRAATFSSREKVNGHDGLHPVSRGEVEHVVTPCVAAEAGVDVLGAYGIFYEGQGVGGRDHVDHVNEWLDVFHPRREVVNGVLLLELEVTGDGGRGGLGFRRGKRGMHCEAHIARRTDNQERASRGM